MEKQSMRQLIKKELLNDPTKYFFMLGLFLYIVFLPISISIRQAGIILMILIYLLNILIKKQKFSFFQFIENKILAFLIIYFLFNAIFISINKDESLEVYLNAFWQCFIIFFIVDSALNNIRVNVNYLLILIMLSVFIQGLDGVYQYLRGYDFIGGIKIWGERLTAAMKTPRVGNFVSLALPAFFVFYFKNKDRFDRLYKKIIYILVIIPPIFLLIFSQTRSGWIGFLAFLIILSLYNFKKFFLPVFGVSSFIAILFWDIIYHRLNFEVFFRDPRFLLWKVGFDLFKMKPIFGHGIANFNEAYNLYKIYPYNIIPQYVHPHNIYIQLLCETGIIGFLLFAFLIISRFVKMLKLFNSNRNIIIWLNFAWINSYLFTAISAHSFFRTWWLGFFMLIFAVTNSFERE